MWECFSCVCKSFSLVYECKVFSIFVNKFGLCVCTCLFWIMSHTAPQMCLSVLPTATLLHWAPTCHFAPANFMICFPDQWHVGAPQLLYAFAIIIVFLWSCKYYSTSLLMYLVRHLTRRRLSLWNMQLTGLAKLWTIIWWSVDKWSGKQNKVFFRFRLFVYDIT